MNHNTLFTNRYHKAELNTALCRSGSFTYNFTDQAGNRTSFVSSISRDFSRDRKGLAVNINAALRESLGGFIDNLFGGNGSITEPEGRMEFGRDSLVYGKLFALLVRITVG